MATARQRTGTFRTVTLGVIGGLLFSYGCVKPAGTSSSTGGTASGQKTAGTPADNGGKQSASPADDSAALAGKISIEGSSTVFPISQAISREFEGKHPRVKVTVGGNGTSSGFKNFLNRQAEICDASRPITQNEIDQCQEKGIEYLELQVAIDGLTVVVNKDNDWVDSMTVAELRKIWDQGSEVKKWSDVKPEWPDQKIELFGAGTDSGTFDYFTEVINGKAKQSRSDYSASENDKILVDGVAGNKYALGYFGFAYYITAAAKLKAVKIAVEEGAEAVGPTPETVENGAYKPLSRPLFIYVNKEELKRPEVQAFVTYYLSDEGQTIVEKRKYVRINQTILAEMRQRLADALAAK